MQKYMFLLFSGLFIILSGCAQSNVQNIPDNTVFVYNHNGKKVMQSSDEEVLDMFTDYQAEVNKVKLNRVGIGDVPGNSELAYKFIVKTEDVKPLHFYVYRNNNYLKVDNIPFIRKIILELPEEDIEWFRNPKGW